MTDNIIVKIRQLASANKNEAKGLYAELRPTIMDLQEQEQSNHHPDESPIAVLEGLQKAVLSGEVAMAHSLASILIDFVHASSTHKDH